MIAGNAVTTAIAELENHDLVSEVGARGTREHGHWVFASAGVGAAPVQDLMEDLGFLAHVDSTEADDVLAGYDDEQCLRDADGVMLVFEYGASY